jgi:hypothetical protein
MIAVLRLAKLNFADRYFPANLQLNPIVLFAVEAKKRIAKVSHG